MTIVLLDGRKLPHQDWEGDDFTPGAKGYVTCTDTATGRMIAYATNGRRDLDGKAIRSAVKPPDRDGINLGQAAQATLSLTGLTLVRPQSLDWADALAHLTAKRGLILQGWYSEIPRDYRYQASANFGHAMWASHASPSGFTRVWDPLDANRTHHGTWVPTKYVRAFLERLQHEAGAGHLFVGYVELMAL